jgi:heme oxygenase
MTTPAPADGFAADVLRGDRFEFGENWRSFLDVLDDERIAEARTRCARCLATGICTD